MKMEHAALYVRDLEAARDFFVTYLEGIPGEGYYNPRTGFRSYFLSFSDGARLELMSRPGISRDQNPYERTGYAHVAFSAGSREAVDALTERLRRDGYRVFSGPRVTGDGYYESCVAGIEEILLEITV